MKDEIKEILDRLNSAMTNNNCINRKLAKKYYDAITNLEQENERLERDLLDNKKTVKLFTNNSANMLEQALDYKSRIDKAVEYIKTSINNPQPFYEYLYGDEDGKIQNMDKLLNILTGGDEE